MEKDVFKMDQMIERMELPELRIRKLSDGFGYGTGPISATELRKNAGEEVYAEAERVINDPEQILVPVDVDESGHLIDDDGCVDGRGVKRIFKGMVEKARSLNRAKVIGGGATMATAALIGLGRTGGKGLNELFKAGIGVLKEKMINFGAHTADHVAPGREDLDSGCGGVDKAPEIIDAAVNNESSIRRSINDMGIADEGLDEVFENIGSYRTEIAEKPEKPYAGKRVMNDIVDEGKIVKQLEGPHKEIAFIINTIRNFTVNQKTVRDATDNELQVFGVDVWRMQDYAEKMYDDPIEQRQAFLSELVYTLAAAAVLTPGDQSIYVIEAAPLAVAA